MENNLKGKKSALVTLIITSAVFTILLIPSFWVTAMLTMMFDSPEAADSSFIWFLFLSFASFPVIIIFSYTAWIFFFVKKYMAAKIISLLPLVSLFIILLALLVYFVTGGKALGLF